MSDERKVLLEAAKLVERGWCTNAMALDAAGEPVGPLDERAAYWCASGAISRAANDFGNRCQFTERGIYGLTNCTMIRLNKLLWEDDIDGNVAEWNDYGASGGAEVAEKMREAAGARA